MAVKGKALKGEALKGDRLLFRVGRWRRR
jgi:hypothetical protein